MLFYIVTIIVCMLAIIAGNVFSVPFEWNNLLWVSVNVVIGTIGVITADGIGATVIRRLLPKKWFMPTNKFWDVPKWSIISTRLLKLRHGRTTCQSLVALQASAKVS